MSHILRNKPSSVAAFCNMSWKLLLYIYIYIYNVYDIV